MKIHWKVSIDVDTVLECVTSYLSRNTNLKDIVVEVKPKQRVIHATDIQGVMHSAYIQHYDYENTKISVDEILEKVIDQLKDSILKHYYLGGDDDV